MRKRGRTDANQEEIVKVLRLYPNISIAVTSAVGSGFPDISVGFKGKNYLFEIKDPNQPPSQKKLTKAEQNFHINWQGQCAIAETVTEILEIIDFSSLTT